MQRYFYRHLDEDIRTKSSAYFLESIGMENPNAGLTKQCCRVSEQCLPNPEKQNPSES
jgi:hypothetical protein